MKEKFLNIRRCNFEAFDDPDFQLAQSVVVKARRALPVQLFIKNKVYGVRGQAAGLAQALAVFDSLGLWLHGMGGTGKTTLAKLVYNHLSPHFQHSACIELQQDERVGEQQLSRLLGGLGANSDKMASAAKLLRTLHEYVRNKAVLILVDNVWSAGQVDKLLPGVFGKGSRIIITSRSSRLPDSLWWQQVNHQLLHRQMVQLPAAASVQLLHASANLDPDFQMPSKELLDAEMALIAACKGLPLALQLTGASLYAKEHNKPPPVAQWKEALTALQDGRNEADSENLLKGILSTTFKALQPAQKHMFLDVAAALRGQPTDLALEVWDIWHGGGARQRFEGLERRNLLSHRRGNLQMHDVLVALGRNLLLNGGEELPTELYGSRVWVDQKGVLQGYRKGVSVLTAQLGYLEKPQEEGRYSLANRRRYYMGEPQGEAAPLPPVSGGEELPTELYGSRVWVDQKGVLQGYRKGVSVLTAQLGYLEKPQEEGRYSLANRRRYYMGEPQGEAAPLPPVSGHDQLQLADLSNARILLLGKAPLPTPSWTRHLYLVTSRVTRPLRLDQLLWLQSAAPVSMDP
eukprot:GHUV01017335.1.p1 GENE.GHUV01017335.1~~GHUV01017335.1.p1  ORF type:complete len:671 (+),score=144.24 GHUV01017335.1:294-2015(+)